MKSKILFSIMFIALFSLLYVPVSYSANPTFNFVMANDTWDSHMVFEMDIYVQSTDVAPIELAILTIGLQIPDASRNGGTVTATWVPGSNELTNTSQIPGRTGINTTGTSVVNGVTMRLIKMAGPTPPGAGNGSMLSNVAPGTRIGRLRLTNTVDFIIATSNRIDIAVTGYPSSLAAYIGTTNTNIWSSGTIVRNLNGPLLPVELTSFQSNVSGREIDLSWETKTEVNARQFEIERSLLNSTDATVLWSSIGVVKASGTSTTANKYSFTEKNLQAGKYQYRIKMVDNDGSFKYSKVIESEISLPKNFELSQNYPNPFNPSTRINYSIPFDSKVTIDVYNIVGERMGQIVNQEQSAGYYTANFSSSSLNRSISSGVYIYKLNAIDKSTGNAFTSIKKMMLLK